MHDDEKNITNDKAVDGMNQPSASTPDDQCLGGCLSVLVSRCLGVSVWRQQSDNNTPVTGDTVHTGQWSGQLRLRIWPGNLTTVSTPPHLHSSADSFNTIYLQYGK